MAFPGIDRSMDVAAFADEFGADPTGHAESCAAISFTILKAKQFDWPDGRATVRMSAGTYRCEMSITIGDGITLLGAGNEGKIRTRVNLGHWLYRVGGET